MQLKNVMLAAALTLVGTGHALAQTRIVTGRVTDSLTSEVVTSGQVSIRGSTGTTIKDDGTFTLALPWSMVGTSNSPPRAAVTIDTGTRQCRSAPSRWKNW